MKKNNKRGFTLAELLIVVAIIAVLVAIAIPVFNSQLEKSREAVDLANTRSAYAEAMTEFLTRDAKTGATFSMAFTPKQHDFSGWTIDTSQLPFAQPTGLAATTKSIKFTLGDGNTLTAVYEAADAVGYKEPATTTGG